MVSVGRNEAPTLQGLPRFTTTTLADTGRGSKCNGYRFVSRRYKIRDNSCGFVSTSCTERKMHTWYTEYRHWTPRKPREVEIYRKIRKIRVASRYIIELNFSEEKGTLSEIQNPAPRGLGQHAGSCSGCPVSYSIFIHILYP